MDNKDVAKRWFNKGNNDLTAGDYILTMPNPPTDTVCFHSQQAAEKYLKGFLAIDSEFSKLFDIASELSGYAVEVRYPLEVDYEIIAEEAQRAMRNAKKLKNSF